MKTKVLVRVASLALVGMLALSACGSDNATGTSENKSSDSNISGSFTGVGASSQKAAIDAWEAGFSAANSKASVNYSPDGSGAGRKALLAGGAQFLSLIHI